jgi:hypothetical protein
MRKYLLLLAVLITCSTSLFAEFAFVSFHQKITGHQNRKNITVIQPNVSMLKHKLQNLSLKEYKKLKGGKISFKEKVSFLFMKHYLKRKTENSNKGQLAFIFGLIAVGTVVLGLFVPFVFVISIITAILAIVFGSLAPKDDSKAKVGKLLGWISLISMALVLILLAIIIASWSFF